MKTLLAFVLVAFVLCVINVTLVQAEEKEEKVKLKDCPVAVQKTIKEQAKGGKIIEIEKETENGKVVYEAEIKKDGKVWEIEVAPDGKLIKKELDDDNDDDDNGKDDD